MKQSLKKIRPRHVASGGMAAAASMLGYKLSEHPEALTKFLGEASQNQIVQAGFFFTVAAWMHSGRVKKEIKENFASLTDAINNVAESLREDLKEHSNILKNHSAELVNLSSKVQNIENNLKQKQ